MKASCEEKAPCRCSESSNVGCTMLFNGLLLMVSSHRKEMDGNRLSASFLPLKFCDEQCIMPVSSIL